MFLLYIYFCQFNDHWDSFPTTLDTSKAVTSSTSARPAVSAAGEATMSMVGVEAPCDGDGSGHGSGDARQGGSLTVDAMDVDTSGQV